MQDWSLHAPRRKGPASCKARWKAECSLRLGPQPPPHQGGSSVAPTVMLPPQEGSHSPASRVTLLEDAHSYEHRRGQACQATPLLSPTVRRRAPLGAACCPSACSCSCVCPASFSKDAAPSARPGMLATWSLTSVCPTVTCHFLGWFQRLFHMASCPCALPPQAPPDPDSLLKAVAPNQNTPESQGS